jgi:hypothetical protein
MTNRELLQKALEEAMNSLFTIAQKAGRDEYLSDMGEVRCYALNRGNSAASALATDELAQNNEPTNESVKAALAQSEYEPTDFVVIDENGLHIYSSTIKQFCHDHINSALDDDSLFDYAKTWKVKSLYESPRPYNELPNPPMFDAFIRAFWRRIDVHKNDFDKELPEEMPVQFRASMETALLVFDKNKDG